MPQSTIHRRINMKRIEPEVKIINFTPGALSILIDSKSSRLDAGTDLEEIKEWPEKKRLEHLGYMMDTIQSSFELVDYIFKIKNVSRAFTHQLVRTRTASYQQQAMRVVDAREHSYLVSCEDPLYQEAANNSLKIYGELVDKGYPVQDCRGILPTAIHTEITMKVNLRALSQMALLRLCKRAEGEYQGVFQQMVEAVLKIHPWAAPLLKVHCVKYGTCAFPRYNKCPVQKHCLDPKDVREQIQEAWDTTYHVANPVAKNGVTM